MKSVENRSDLCCKEILSLLRRGLLKPDWVWLYCILGGIGAPQLHVQDVYINISLLFSDIQIITVLVSWILLLVSRFAQ